MKIFVDANVLVSVINKEYPLFTYSARILSLSNHPNYTVFTSPVCLAITWYFAEKKHKKNAREKIRLLCQNLSIAEATKSSVYKTLENSSIHDFEDGLEYYAARENGCDYILTEDRQDFYFSEIRVESCRNFFEKVVVKRK